MKCLQAFYAKNNPENLARVRELYAKYGKGTRIWNALEKKYLGKTASYTKASLSAVLLQPESCCYAC